MQLTSGVTYTTVVADITVTASTRPTDKTTVALVADYTLTFTVTSRLLSTSVIQLFFPIDQVKYTSGTTKCFNGANDLGCSFTDTNSTHFQTEIVQWCNTGAE